MNKIFSKIKVSFNSNYITKENQQSGKSVTIIKSVIKEAYYVFIINSQFLYSSKNVDFHGTWVIFLW